MPVPPGASYRTSNDLIIAKRRSLNLEDPVRIQFTRPWEVGNPLFDWYNHRRNLSIHTMQLRKEREYPFFHEYIVFRLRDFGGCYRIDRRQRPDEDIPLESIYQGGVEAYDTIEHVRSLDDTLYCPSDCIVEIEFKVDVPIALLPRIFEAIHEHPRARLYTLQRFNCYFFAQTILLCTARSAIEYSVQAIWVRSH